MDADERALLLARDVCRKHGIMTGGQIQASIQVAILAATAPLREELAHAAYLLGVLRAPTDDYELDQEVGRTLGRIESLVSASPGRGA